MGEIMHNSLFRLIVFLCSLVSITACSSQQPPKRAKVGLCIVATGKYDVYAESLIESARLHFCKNHDVTYFVFTDGNVQEASDVKKVYQKRLGWPYDTLKRFHVYEANKEVFKDMDYLFATDADMRFAGDVGDEILGKRVATLHPGFYAKPGQCSYEKNKRSTAYVSKREGKTYYCGGFYGGSREEFLKFISTAIKQIDSDLQWNHIAVWHDESHLNRYFIDHPPTVVLNPSYCYPESWNLPFDKKLLALDKNHSEMRK